MQPAAQRPRSVGSYRLYDALGAGGMGTVYLARRFARGGFHRLVAVKRLHPHLATNAAFVGAFLDEARVASRIHHPNVVAPIDVVAEGGDVFLVFPFVAGVSLASLLRATSARPAGVPPRVATSVMVDVLAALQAAHEARSDAGEPLGLIHRDVSPQNILVGRDGTAYLLDFGIAKAAGRAQTTDDGIVKGKRGYMAPEHLLGNAGRGSDLYAAGVVLCEMLTARPLFADEALLADRIAGNAITPEGLAPGPLAGVVVRALAPAPEARFASARAMSEALEASGVATAREVSAWVECVAAEEFDALSRRIAHAEAALDEPAPSSPEPNAPPHEPTLHDAPWSAPSSSASDGPAAPSSRPRRRALALVAAGALVVTALVALAGARERAASPTLGAPNVPSGGPARASPAMTTAPASGSLPAPEPATATRDAPPAVSADPAPPPRKRTKLAAPSTVAPRDKRAACKPYVVDTDGRTQFNEACLRRNDGGH